MGMRDAERKLTPHSQLPTPRRIRTLVAVSVWPCFPANGWRLSGSDIRPTNSRRDASGW
jgi:hypothetical protein